VAQDGVQLVGSSDGLAVVQEDHADERSLQDVVFRIPGFDGTYGKAPEAENERAYLGGCGGATSEPSARHMSIPTPVHSLWTRSAVANTGSGCIPELMHPAGPTILRDRRAPPRAGNPARGGVVCLAMAAKGHPRFIAFADGSSLVNPGGPGGTGFVVLDRARLEVRFGGTRWVEDGPARVTNNRMELRAMLDAFHGIPSGEAVEARSDSRYVIDALSKWIHGWRRKGWRTASGGPVLNRDIIEELAGREANLCVRYTWVRGHVGHPVNEVCDALAAAAARGQPGPGQDEVFAALRAERLLEVSDVLRVIPSAVAPQAAKEPRSGQLSMRL